MAHAATVDYDVHQGDTVAHAPRTLPRKAGRLYGRDSRAPDLM
jgi:hypothetical protein